MKIKNRLAILMAEKQMRYKELEAKTGLSRNILSQIKNNPDHNLSLDTIELLAAALNIHPIDLLDCTQVGSKIGVGEPL